MNTIFFDLETSDLNFVGQILNYAFVEVDLKWRVVSKLCGDIRISPLQLPSADAILINRIDVLEHQKKVKCSEAEAMLEIHKWLFSRIDANGGKVRLVGFNSSKFDLPYLRTSMIRNGLNPYFGGNLKYGDLIHVIHKASIRPNFIAQEVNKKPTFKLEYICRKLGILENEKQEHNSYADVLLEIKLAKVLADQFGIDVRTYSAYEAAEYENTIVHRLIPSWDDNKKESFIDYRPMVILDNSKTQCLWIDLKEWKEGKGRDSIYWFNKQTSEFFAVCLDDEIKNWVADAFNARKDLFDVNLQNFWPPKNCDIEQFIYMLEFSELGALYEAIWMKDLTNLKKLQSKYGSQLYLRFLAANSPIEEVKKLISDYALYRYGGRLKLNKDNFESKFEEGVYNPDFHPVYNELYNQILELEAKSCGNDKVLLASLREFYDKSLIKMLVGSKLEKIIRVKKE